MISSSLELRKALVTGAGRGIGEAIAQALAQQGAYVICVSRTAANCERVAQTICEQGGRAEAIAVDVTDRAAVKATCEDILKRLEGVDILVNNAGILRNALMVQMSYEDWDDVIQANLTSAFLWTKGLLYAMARKRWGRMINISSVVGKIGGIGQANYAAAKAGLMGFTKSVAREVASRGICVNAIAPGFIETDMTRSIQEKWAEEFVKMIPMKRVGSVQDIAALVAFLCSDAAAYITGQVLTVDGGMTM
ncbi:MAG: 3-oxoacyl-[acyl-carrier-protein] reductase [Puniceicoccales bacterium]|jgi:3-oxoacyl-[acyl-carrier protein] reductase|nr:3-oxoacyl-[acyl-carrier-protein] reductase [Puniceicoccales bacterium]